MLNDVDEAGVQVAIFKGKKATITATSTPITTVTGVQTTQVKDRNGKDLTFAKTKTSATFAVTEDGDYTIVVTDSGKYNSSGTALTTPVPLKTTEEFSVTAGAALALSYTGSAIVK